MQVDMPDTPCEVAFSPAPPGDEMLPVAHRHKLDQATVRALHLMFVSRALGFAQPLRLGCWNVHS